MHRVSCFQNEFLRQFYALDPALISGESHTLARGLGQPDTGHLIVQELGVARTL